MTTLARGLDPCPSIGMDVDAPIWSSSVALFITTPDADQAVSLRLCTYPDAEVAWLWVHVMTPDGSWAYNVDHIAAPRERLDVLAPDVVYEDLERQARFIRHGTRAAPDGAEVDVAVRAHTGTRAPDEAGTVPVRIRGSFTPNAAAGGTLPGRSELLGRADLSIEVDGAKVGRISGWAHWHEQHQEAPRFVTPFTYASLRGPDLNLVALIGSRASGGFARGAGGDRQFTSAHIPEPVDGQHDITLLGEEGAIEGELTVRGEIVLPLYGRPWWGTLVTGSVGGHPVSGSVNRWRFRPGADPITPTGDPSQFAGSEDIR